MTAKYWLLVLCTSLGHGIAAEAATIQADDVRVIDGDTLEILSAGISQRVRLQGIDAPEHDQPFGEASSASLAACLEGRSVIIHSTKLDRYGRHVATVLADGRDCNLQQVHQGMAWHYKHYQNEQSAKIRINYAHAERHAKNTQLGLWSACAIAPWDWRRGIRHCSAVSDPVTNPNISVTSIAPNISTPIFNPSINKYCQQLINLNCEAFTSCQQAKQALSCGNHNIDGDKDGTPCEQLCR